MGCGQSSIKRSNTTPITVKENKVMTNKDYQNQWNNDRPATDRNIRNVDWNVDNSKSNTKLTNATGRGSIELYDSSSIKQKQSDEKNKEAQLKIRRQKTEQLVSRLADHPDLIADQTKEIFSRLENTKIEKSKKLEQIDPKVRSKATPVEDDKNLQQKQRFSLAEILESSQNENEPEQPPKTLKAQASLPGAAVIARTVISYDNIDNKRSKTTRRVDSDSDEEFSKSKLTPVLVGSKQGVQRVIVHQSSVSNNESTLIGTQERQRNMADINQNGKVYKDKKQELEGLLKELNDDDSDDDLMDKKPKASAIKVIQGPFEPNEASDDIFGYNEDQLSPEKQYGELKQLDIGDYEIKDEDEDDNFMESNNFNDQIINFEGKDMLNYEPKTSIFTV